MDKVYRFIEANIDKTVIDGRIYKEDGLIELPYPYTTPTTDGMFREMYYWDTYFTQKALFLLNRSEQALFNLENFAFLLEKYGKIPNGNRLHYLRNSQPPFFGLMIADVMNQNGFSSKEAFRLLEKEYLFWTEKRITANGLCAYNFDCNEQSVDDGTFRWYADRTGILLSKNISNYRCIYAECESGWDFSPRFNSRCIYHNAVDLNSLLFADEMLLSKWARQNGDVIACNKYCMLSEERKKVTSKLLKSSDGIWFDYDYERGLKSNVVSCAAFFPFFVGLDDSKIGFTNTLNKLERRNGLVACECGGSYQWAEPNCWAPLMYIATVAATRIGLTDTAVRIAKKYVDSIGKIFSKTGQLWEKYNAITADLDVSSEYGTPKMLGWTAGVYIALKHFLEEGIII